MNAVPFAAALLAKASAAVEAAILTVTGNNGGTLRATAAASTSRLVLLALFVAMSQSIVSAQVLNLSHDLVSHGIAGKNLTPNDPSLDAGPLIFAGVQYAYFNAIPLVTADKGNYYLLSDQQQNATLIFGHFSNLTLDLADSTLFFRGPYLPNGIQLWECTNFTLKNFKTDFINPPYTHVQLTSVNAAARTIGYATLPGWPDPTTFNGLTSPFGGENDLWLAVFRNGQIVPGTTRSRVARPIANNTLTLIQDGTPWTQAATLATLQPGDTIAVVARGGGPPILIWEGDGITLSHVTIQGSGETAVQFYASKNSTADTVSVVPRPGNGLVGSNGDAIHFASARQNNHIVNSYVTRTLDDGLVMDNQHAALVLSQSPPRQLTVKRDQYLRFPNGTPVNFVDPATTLESAGGIIISQVPADSLSPQFNGSVDLTFDRDLPALPAGMAMVYADPLTRGQGSTIADSTSEDIYAGRGIWIAGLQGLTIERNTVRRTSMAGIILSTSTDPFDTGDIGPPAHDVVIQNNVVDGALGPAAGGTGAQVGLGGIQVVSTDNQQFGFASAAGNTNISIVGNTILNSGRSGIWVGEVNGGTINNNTIGLYDQKPELPVWGIPSQFLTQVTRDFASPIVVRYSTGVTSQSTAISPTFRVLVPDGTSLSQAFSAYPETRWFAMTVEPGKTYVIDAVDPTGDLTTDAIGTLGVYDVDSLSSPPEANVDCTAANGRRPPAVDVNSDGIRCIVRTALPTAGMQQNKRPVYVKVTRMDPASGGGAQFKIRAREATIYGRWLTAGYDYHVEVENTAGDSACVEIAQLPRSGVTYAAGPGWSGPVTASTLNVPAFGAAKVVIPKGVPVGADTEGTLRINACSTPTNLLPAGLHVSTYAFDPVGNRYIYFFTATANEGKTRTRW